MPDETGESRPELPPAATPPPPPSNGVRVTRPLFGRRPRRPRGEPGLHKTEARLIRYPRWVAIVLSVTLVSFSGAFLGFLGFFSVRAGWATAADVIDDYLCAEAGQAQLLFGGLESTSEIYLADGSLLSKLYDEVNRYSIPLNDMGHIFRVAVLASEDADFFEHEGVDMRAIARALLADIGSRSAQQGGSTITQQLVKLNFVGDADTIKRKVCEAQTAIALEEQYTKEQILERYMNQVYFGSGAYGAFAAAQVFYGVPPEQLTIEQAATLAATIRAPTRYSPFLNADTSLDRRNTVIRAMAENGFITAAEAELGLASPLSVANRPNEFTYGNNPAPHFEAYVRGQLLDSTEFDAVLGPAGSDARIQAVFNGGLRIETTLDPVAQQKAIDVGGAATEGLYQPCDLEADGQCDLDTAFAAVEVATGAIRALYSSVDFSEEQYNLAAQGRRNPGSSFKVFVLLEALRQGIPTGTCYNAPSPLFIEEANWRVSNASEGGGGVINLEAGTRGSVNTLFAQLMMDVGPQNVATLAHQMGIASPLEDLDANGLPYVPPSIALGAKAVTPLEMATAYAVIPRGGVYVPSYAIERISDASGRVLFEHTPRPQQIVNPAVASVTTTLLEGVVTSGTGTKGALPDGRPVAGKTGTHQNYQDAWFAGYTAQYASAVWVGYKEEQISMREVSRDYGRMFGGKVPAEIFSAFMGRLHEGLEVLAFPEPPAGASALRVTPRTTVPAIVGLNVNDPVQQETLSEVLLTQPVTVEFLTEPSTEPAGTIFSVEPPVGSQLAHCGAVRAHVSSGEQPNVAVPDVTGQTVVQAQGTLASFQLGFALAQVETTDPAQIGVVVGSDPPPGTEVPIQSVVTISVGVAPAVTTTTTSPTTSTTSPPSTGPPTSGSPPTTVEPTTSSTEPPTTTSTTAPADTTSTTEDESSS